MDNIKDFFVFNKNEQRGVWLLLVLIGCVTVVNIVLLNRPKHADAAHISTLAAKAEKEIYAKSGYSARHKKGGGRNKRDSLFYFDPNTATVEEWVLLGLSPKQASSIANYTSKGGRFEAPYDLKRSFVISEQFFAKVEQWIKIIPSTKSRNSQAYDNKNKPYAFIVNLNTADTAELKKLYGVGTVLAQRIVKYRDALGGFFSVDQLSEVYGLKLEVVDANRTKLYVEKGAIRTITFFKMSAKELASHPYISHKLAYTISEICKEKPVRTKEELSAALPAGVQMPENLWPYLGLD